MHLGCLRHWVGFLKISAILCAGFGYALLSLREALNSSTESKVKGRLNIADTPEGSYFYRLEAEQCMACPTCDGVRCLARVCMVRTSGTFNGFNGQLDCRQRRPTGGYVEHRYAQMEGKPCLAGSWSLLIWVTCVRVLAGHWCPHHSRATVWAGRPAS